MVRGGKMGHLVKYLKSEDALDSSVEHMLFIGIAVAGALAVAYMIYNGIKAGQKAMGEDIVTRG